MTRIHGCAVVRLEPRELVPDTARVTLEDVSDTFGDESWIARQVGIRRADDESIARKSHGSTDPGGATR